MENMLKEIRERVLADVKEAEVSSKLEDIRVRVLGKKGELTAILRGMSKLSPEERPKVGQMVNEARTAIENAHRRSAPTSWRRGGKGSAGWRRRPST